jgi:RNA polymerase sigma-70 factor (ECF subfamily)
MPTRVTRQLGVLLSLPTNNSNGGECAAATQLASASFSSSLVQQLRLSLKTDEELIADLVANEPDALTVLFRRHSAVVFRIARRILRNDTEAEDTVQQVFLDVFRAAEQFEPEKSSFKCWLLMFAYHRTLNCRRRLSTHRFYDSESIEELPQELIDGASRQLPFLPGEVTILLEQLLKTIQPRQRRAIELTYYEGLTAEEASQVTGESVRVFRHNLYRGLERLRSVLCRNSRECDRETGKQPQRTSI